jgi:hypothetical protein
MYALFHSGVRFSARYLVNKSAGGQENERSKTFHVDPPICRRIKRTRFERKVWEMNIPGKLHLAEGVPTRGMFTLCTTQAHINRINDKVMQEELQDDPSLCCWCERACPKYPRTSQNQALSQPPFPPFRHRLTVRVQVLESITSLDSFFLNHTIIVKTAVSAIHLLSGIR